MVVKYHLSPQTIYMHTSWTKAAVYEMVGLTLPHLQVTTQTTRNTKKHLVRCLVYVGRLTPGGHWYVEQVLCYLWISSCKQVI